MSLMKDPMKDLMKDQEKRNCKDDYWSDDLV